MRLADGAAGGNNEDTALKGKRLKREVRDLLTHLSLYGKINELLYPLRLCQSKLPFFTIVDA